MTNDVRLRDIEPDDLPIFFEHQLDADATRMAAFPSRDRAAFDAHWATNILGNPATINHVLDGIVAYGQGAQGGAGIKFGMPDTAIYQFVSAKTNRNDFGGYF